MRRPLEASMTKYLSFCGFYSEPYASRYPRTFGTKSMIDLSKSLIKAWASSMIAP